MTHRRFTIAGYLIMLVTLVDQLSKWVILRFVMHSEPGVVPVNGFFNLVLVENTGATFGLFSHLPPTWAPYFFLGVDAVILFLLGRWLWRTSSTPVAVALGFIIGGALGNMIDRARLGAVVDFLDFYVSIAGKEHHWFAFNVADSAIDIGVALLVLDGFVRKR
jgi:signal peptidase II